MEQNETIDDVVKTYRNSFQDDVDSPEEYRGAVRAIHALCDRLEAAKVVTEKTLLDSRCKNDKDKILLG